jgi:hypothetical protein
MSRSHVVITGTGRCGTSFLVELLTHLGLPTGFTISDIESKRIKLARAGFEHDIRASVCPFIVKAPWFCDHADEVFSRNDIVIKHVFVPIRELQAAAESRRQVAKNTISSWSFLKQIKFAIKPKMIPGGLWNTHSIHEGAQEEILLRQIYNLVLSVSDTAVPVTFIRYPRIVKDPQYLFDKLKPILGDIDYETFSATFIKIVRPEWVHSFNKNDS